MSVLSGAWARSRHALGYLRHVDSWLALAVLALLIAALQQLAAFPLIGARVASLAALGLWGAFFYLALHKASRGSRRLPRLADFRDSWSGLVAPLARGALVAIWFIVPLALCVDATVGFDDFIERLHGHPLALFRQPWPLLYGLLAASLAYLPAALLTSCLRGHPLLLLDPSYGLRRALALGQPFAEVVVALCPLVLTSVLMASLATALEQAMPIPLVAATSGQLLQLWIPLAQARLLGELAEQQRDLQGDV
jgi:hypothetical protein